MRKLLAPLMMTLTGFAGTAMADKPMVVVELYTSQGCSSCPPADKVLTELAKQDDVIAFGMHVDYWDYLGWKDQFAIPAFSERQQTYNALLPSRYRLVTPQMVIHGMGQAAGGTGKSIDRINMLVEDARAIKERAALNIVRTGKTLTIMLSASDKNIGTSTVQLVHFEPTQKVAIKAGENRGKNIEYTNVVSAWETIGKWDGSSAMTITHTLKQSSPLAVVVQTKRQGPVLVARKLN